MLLVLDLAYSSIKNDFDIIEDDVSHFPKAKSDYKVDEFLENSKSLLKSLSEQQDKLEKLSKDYIISNMKDSRHSKTLSYLPYSARVFDNTESGRESKSSLDNSFKPTKSDYKISFQESRNIKKKFRD